MAVKKLSEKKFRKLYQLIDTFVQSREGDFPISDLIQSPGIQEDKDFAGLPEDYLVQELILSRLAFMKSLKVFTPRHGFFQGAHFIISLTEEEILGRFLVPGHRFLPFHSEEVDPWRCTLLKDGEKIETKVIRKTVDSLQIYHTLLGWENAPSIFMADHEENREIFESLENPKGKKVTVTVFDLDRLLQDPRFTPGARLLCEVQDWRAGVFSISFLPKEDIPERRKSPWTSKMEKGFREVFDRYGLDLPIFEQVAIGYFHTGAEVLKNPILHFGGLLNLSDRLYIVPFGMESRLWYEEKLTMSTITPWEKQEELRSPESFAEVLEVSGLLRKEAELEAYIREELFRLRGVCEDPKELGQAVMNRLNQGEDFVFDTEVLEKAFNRHFKRLINKVIRNYNYFTDQEIQKNRSQILTILDDYYAWLRHLDDFDAIDPAQIQVQTFAETAQTISFLAGFLDALNTGDNSPDDLKALNNHLPQLQQNLEDMRQEISDELEELASKSKKSRRQFTLIRPEHALPKGEARKEREILQFPKSGAPSVTAPKDEAINQYTLKVSIRDIRPMIWRTFQVPGDLTLDELHEILQVVMGWEHEHAYGFTINNRSYSCFVDGPFGDMGMDNDDASTAEYTLDELGLREKQRFTYTYDFGDTWEHDILVSKITLFSNPADPALMPVCLKGQRACPPEDCGGVWGYSEILEALNAPRKKKNQELIENYGTYDPEYFNVDEVNEEITSMVNPDEWDDEEEDDED